MLSIKALIYADDKSNTVKLCKFNLSICKELLMGLFSKPETGKSDEITVDCGDVLDISKVSEFHKQLKEALGKGGEVILDAEALTRIDVTSLQLCAAFFNDAAARKVTAKWRSPSDSLIKSASLLGLSHSLGLPEAN